MSSRSMPRWQPCQRLRDLWWAHGTMKSQWCHQEMKWRCLKIRDANGSMFINQKMFRPQNVLPVFPIALQRMLFLWVVEWLALNRCPTWITPHFSETGKSEESIRKSLAYRKFPKELCVNSQRHYAMFQMCICTQNKSQQYKHITLHNDILRGFIYDIPLSLELAYNEADRNTLTAFPAFGFPYVLLLRVCLMNHDGNSRSWSSATRLQLITLDSGSIPLAICSFYIKYKESMKITCMQNFQNLESHESPKEKQLDYPVTREGRTRLPSNRFAELPEWKEIGTGNASGAYWDVLFLPGVSRCYLAFIERYLQFRQFNKFGEYEGGSGIYHSPTPPGMYKVL